MNYTDFISLINEENRPPGGKKTIREIMINSFIDRKSKVLEVGCTNGFTTLEIARTMGCKTYGIDINKNSLKNARSRLSKERANFSYGDAYNIPFKDNSFDLVVCNNATSFMEDKKKAISEYIRVLKPWGFIAITPMYYLKNPSKKIVGEVSNIIGTKINIRKKEEWIDLISKTDLEIYYTSDYEFKKKTEHDLERFVSESLDKENLRKLSKETFDKIKERWFYMMNVFNENLGHMGYSVILLRKRNELEEPELFGDVIKK